MITFRTLALLASSFVALPAAAQQLTSRPVPTGKVESWSFQSPSMGVKYSINVGPGMLSSRSYPGFSLTLEYHPGMGHTDVVGATVVRGMRVLYPK